ncbi:uncharacterized protein LOC142775163 [Rhipicephalus microplus]|uniref:uncharacterized protein LOC142775163 n=1 Tax=Rhipicephalus microplus TaxID=6941 RepID=UPI003F6C7ED8
MITLIWIHGNYSKLSQFVKHRVFEITQITEKALWGYCPGEDNPADVLTRGIPIRTLRACRYWWHGPEWLSQPKLSWPSEPNQYKPINEEAEIETQHVFLQASSRNLHPVIDIRKHSDLKKLLRVTAWVFRFVDRCHGLQTSLSEAISARELSKSEMFWVRYVQLEVFANDVEQLQLGHPLPKQSRLMDLHPFLDQNRQLRLGGRLERMDTTYDEKHLVILPQRHPFTSLVVIEAHCRALHGGVANTLMQIRQRYWIIRARRKVKRIINKCFLCQRYNVKPGNVQYAPMPEDRLLSSGPFDAVGLDFAGPLYIKQRELHGDTSKADILLFTCATTRAVHLELTSAISTSAFFLAFRRFLARRGVPITMYSDNALAFKRASRDLRNIWSVMKSSPFAYFLLNYRIEWKFIVPGAPWWGGWWERLVRTVKSSLRKVMGKSKLSSEQAETMLLEVQAVVNSRPLTYTYTDSKEPSAICPAHFLVGR